MPVRVNKEGVRCEPSDCEYKVNVIPTERDMKGRKAVRGQVS